MKTETQLLLEICDYLKREGIFFWRSNNIPAGGRTFGTFRALPKYTPRGLPDIMIVHGGKFIGLEVKREGSENEREKNGRKIRAGKLTPDQAEYGAALVKAGGDYACVRSVQDVMDIFNVYPKLIPTDFVHRHS